MTKILEYIKFLRKCTGASIIECKNALLETNNDILLAKKIITQKLILSAKKKLDRKTPIYSLFAFENPNHSIIILATLFCETDFVAQSENFLNFRIFVAKIFLKYDKMEYISFDDTPIIKINNLNKDNILLIQSWNEQELNMEFTIEDILLKEIGFSGENIKIANISIYK